MRCPDCKGSKIYQPFFGPEEKCANCNGTGEVADATGTAITPVREQDGVIYFSVTSDGTTGPEWIDRLGKKGFRISNYAERVLRSSDFKPTNGVTTEIAILKGELFEDRDRFTGNIRAEAGRRGLTAPNAEVACLIREKFSDREIEEMGLLWLVVMHEPIEGSDGDPYLLGTHRSGGARWLDTCYGGFGGGWSRVGGFAFVVPQAT